MQPDLFSQEEPIKKKDPPKPPSAKEVIVRRSVSLSKKKKIIKEEIQKRREWDDNDEFICEKRGKLQEISLSKVEYEVISGKNKGTKSPVEVVYKRRTVNPNEDLYLKRRICEILSSRIGQVTINQLQIKFIRKIKSMGYEATQETKGL